MDDLNKLKDAEKEALKIEESHVVTPNGTVKAVAKSNDSNFGLGLLLIGVGTAFFLTRFVGFAIHNWWALFILIPACSQFCEAWKTYQQNGRLGHSGRSALTGGLFISLVASAFLFSISWNFVWPFFLILGGISAILGGWFD
ncbi:MAG: hypothetical protein AAF614_11520 [Chloroflexota bacterium]